MNLKNIILGKKNPKQQKYIQYNLAFINYKPM